MLHIKLATSLALVFATGDLAGQEHGIYYVTEFALAEAAAEHLEQSKAELTLVLAQPSNEIDVTRARAFAYTDAKICFNGAIGNICNCSAPIIHKTNS